MSIVETSNKRTGSPLNRVRRPTLKVLIRDQKNHLGGLRYNSQKKNQNQRTWVKRNEMGEFGGKRPPGARLEKKREKQQSNVPEVNDIKKKTMGFGAVDQDSETLERN